MCFTRPTTWNCWRARPSIGSRLSPAPFPHRGWQALSSPMPATGTPCECGTRTNVTIGATLHCQVVADGRLRDFLGFNRAKHAVVEAAILATRVAHLDPGADSRAVPAAAGPGRENRRPSRAARLRVACELSARNARDRCNRQIIALGPAGKRCYTPPHERCAFPAPLSPPIGRPHVKDDPSIDQGGRTMRLFLSAAALLLLAASLVNAAGFVHSENFVVITESGLNPQEDTRFAETVLSRGGKVPSRDLPGVVQRGAAPRNRADHDQCATCGGPRLGADLGHGSPGPQDAHRLSVRHG